MASYGDYMKVGIRDLKAKLSEYVSAATAGEEIIVTDRGRPVARLTGLIGASSISRGIDEGWIEPPRRTKLQPPLLFRSDETIATALDDDRG